MKLLKEVYEINLSDADEFQENIELLELDQQRWYQDAFSSYKHTNNGYTEKYFQNARYIIYAKAGNTQKFCRCGMTNQHGTSTCDYRKFCSRCATLVGEEHLRRLQPAYTFGNWASLTISLSDAIPLDLGLICELFDVYDIILKSLQKIGAIRGYFSVREVSVPQFLPLRVLPHLHILLDADAYDQEMPDEIEAVLDSFLEKRGSEVRSDVKLKLIDDRTYYQNTIKYFFKPMDIHTKYKLAIDTQVSVNPNRIVALNSESKDLAVGMMSLHTHAKGVKQSGSLHPLSETYIVPSPYRAR